MLNGSFSAIVGYKFIITARNQDIPKLMMILLSVLALL